MVVVSSDLMALGETLTINVGLAAALGSAKIPTKTATVTATPATLRILCCNSISLTNYLSFLNKEVWNFADFLPESKLPSSIRNDEISITIYDNYGHVITSGLTSLTAHRMQPGMHVNFGDFSDAPTVVVVHVSG